MKKKTVSCLNGEDGEGKTVYYCLKKCKDIDLNPFFDKGVDAQYLTQGGGNSPTTHKNLRKHSNETHFYSKEINIVFKGFKDLSINLI